VASVISFATNLFWYVVGFLETYNGAVTAVATIAIAAFTLTLKRSTDKLWEAGEKQFTLAKETADRQAGEIQAQIKIAQNNAKAAQKAADASVATERARFYVEIVKDNFIDCINAASTWENTPQVDESPVSASNTPMARLRFRNYGKTPGIVEEVGLGLVYSETIPDPVYDIKAVKENIIGPDKTTEEIGEAITGASLTLGQAKKVRDGTGTIWLYGYVIYDDVFGERQTHRFFQRLVPVIPRTRYVLQAYDHKHYNRST
jgi:hypothetical protein